MADTISKNGTNRNITEGVIWRAMILFFLPIVGGSLVQQLYNTADAIIVGRFIGKEALASVGGSPSIISMIVITGFNGLSNGAGVIVAQHFGANNKKKVSDAVHTAMAFAFVFSIAITILGIFGGDYMLRLMNTPEEIFDITSTYVHIFFVGMLPTLTYNMGSAMMRSIGDSKRPFYYLVVCSFTNIILDFLFVAVFHMGVAGAATATVIAQTISAILVLYSLSRDYDEIHFRFRDLKLHPALLKSEIYVGIPASILSLIYGITNIVIQADINVLSLDTVAAWSAFGKVDLVFWTANGAFGITVATFVGQNYGAKQMDRVFKSARICLGMAFAVCGTLLLFITLACKPLLTLFSKDPNVISIGASMMYFLAPSYLIYIFIENLSGTLRGLGDVFIPTVITLGSLFFIRLPLLLILFPKSESLKLLMFSYPSSWIPAVICLAIYYFWMKKRKLR